MNTDTTKCTNNKCTIKDKCNRFIVKSCNPMQSYSFFMQNADGECSMYIKPTFFFDDKGLSKADQDFIDADNLENN